jgi:predicted amidophosphoribosyltransferase
MRVGWIEERAALRDFGEGLVELVLPRSCVACRRPGAALCQQCRPVARPIGTDFDGLPVIAAASYDGALRAALLGYKERGRRDLRRPLADLLGVAVHVLGGPGGATLVPVPSTARARRARGGDHVVRLARPVARRLGLSVSTPLRLQRATRDSAGLTEPQRAANLDHAMVAAPPARPVSVILIDDIVTTGATLREAARALRAASWPVQGAAVIAATPRRAAGGRQWQVVTTRSSVGMT